jgi:hypothetical protein
LRLFLSADCGRLPAANRPCSGRAHKHSGHATGALFPRICSPCEATPLAWLINSGTLCKPIVDVSILSATSAKGILNMVKATTKKAVKKSAAKKSGAKKAVKKGAAKKTARKAAAKKRPIKSAAKKSYAKKAAAKKSAKKAAAKKAAARKVVRKPAARKAPPPPPPGPPETA